jgi:hypothetical protein
MTSYRSAFISTLCITIATASLGCANRKYAAIQFDKPAGWDSNPRSIELTKNAKSAPKIPANVGEYVWWAHCDAHDPIQCGGPWSSDYTRAVVDLHNWYYHWNQPVAYMDGIPCDKHVANSSAPVTEGGSK